MRIVYFNQFYHNPAIYLLKDQPMYVPVRKADR